MKNLLPTAIRDEHYEAVAQLIEEFVRQDDLEMFLPMLIDTAPIQALTHLAEFFSVLGIEGWEFASTETERRALLKQAVELHRYKGTPWAVKEAVRRVGFLDVFLEEGADNFTHKVEKTDSRRTLYLDGSFTLDGTYDLGGGTGGTAMIFTSAPRVAWAFFRVLIRLANGDFVDAAIMEKLRLVINEYKNLRSWLSDIGFILGESENTTVSHDAAGQHSTMRNIRDYWTNAVFLDGTFLLNGSVALGSDGITDSPNPIFRANVRLDGAFALDGSVWLNGTTTKGTPNFPVALGMPDAQEAVTMTDNDILLINP